MRRTKSSLHGALIGLAREKPYSAIAVKEILNRANVGRSTFYTHFRDKDDLLESGIHEVLQSARDGARSLSAVERLLSFSLPLLTHIDLVLNWWVDSSPMLTPDAVDEQFRGLIAPSLGGLVTQSP